MSADPALTSSESTQSEPGGKSEVPSHASFELRLAAGLVDALVLGAPAFLAICFVMGFDRCVESFLDILDAKEDAASRAIPAAQWLSGLVVAVITTLFWVHWSGRTPGKRVLGLRVVSYPGYGALSYPRAALRSGLAVVSALTVVGLVVIGIMVSFREDKRGYHDLVGRTVVVRET